MGSSHFLNELERRVLVFDGSMGATIQSMPLDIEKDYLGRENCVDILNKSRPELVEEIHGSFLEAGSDAVETNTFGANKLTFTEFDDELASMAFDINKQAAELARSACAKHSTDDKPRFAIGSIGPGTKLLTLGQTTWEKMLDSYCEQMKGLIAGGVDAIIIETCQDLLQVKCAVNAALKALEESGKSHEDIPIMVSVTIETTGTMLVGTEIAAAVSALRQYPIASLGLNCATGPVEMEEHIEHLSKHWDRLISVIPNAGLPVLVEGRTEFPLQPEPLGEALARYIDEYGVNIVGGCCGTGPEHIAKVVEHIEGKTPKQREDVSYAPGCTSLYSPVEYRQENSFFIIGERLNASGSRKFKRLLEEEDWDKMISMGREQSREGANALDINVDYAGRDNVADMEELVHRVVRQVDAPLMIDSTQTATIEAGLKHAGGKCIINSANFEDGEEKFDEICRLAKTYGAALVIGTIDEDKEAAMARTADRKYSIAERALKRATEKHGLKAEDIFFDPLVLPISTGMDEDRRSALELVEGTKRISEAFPEVQITCGLSNVSFGLNAAARVVLNSVFLHELTEAGMTSAIVHASKILPLNKISDEQRDVALDLIYDRRAKSKGGTGLRDGVTDENYDPLQKLIDLFKDAKAADTKKKKRDRTLEERLSDHIVDGEKEGLHETLDAAMKKYAPLEIINQHLLGGMKIVGELFGSGQMQLPFVLQSAETMKMAVAHLEPHMEVKEGDTKGTVVLATVKGDVHDIGKNLVDIILSNNGYTVKNIGIKQTLGNMIEAWKEHKADAIGMSGLLVKSVTVMEENLKELNEQELDMPIILGGAALTRHYCESHLRNLYDGKLFYGKDAFDGLRVCDMLMEGKTDELDEEVEERLGKRAETQEKVKKMRAKEKEKAAAEADGEGDGGVAVARKSDVATDVKAPEPPFTGTRVIEDLDLDDIYPYINPIALFRGQWGFKKGSMSKEEYDQYIKDVVEPVFERMKRECKEQELLQPKVVYGYFECQSDGDDLLIYDPDDSNKVIEKFSFPRQDGKKHLCISDFFKSVDSGERDVIGFSCVTMGPEASRKARELFENNEYTEYLYLHGLGVETAEALAELWHKRMRAEMGIGNDDSPEIKKLFTQKYRGSRYSFGYPACPEMSDQEKLFRLLEPQRIGCELTENWQIDPEQSTSAIIVHHPEAKYFNV